MSKLNKAVDSFVLEMKDKLKMNSHKSGWDSCPRTFFLYRLKQEVKELQESLINGNPGEIISECADVANFAMMLANLVNEAREIEK